MPSAPDFQETARVTVLGHDLADGFDVQTGAALFRAVFSFAVGGLEFCRNPRQLGGLDRIFGRGSRQTKLEQIQFSSNIRRKLQAVEAGRLRGQLHAQSDGLFVGGSGQGLGVFGDERRLNP